MTFIVTFDDGRAFLGRSDPKTWAEIKGAAVRYTSYRVLSEHTHSVVEIASIKNGRREPAASATAAERLEWSFATNNWDFLHLPRQGFQRYDIYDARKANACRWD